MSKFQACHFAHTPATGIAIAVLIATTLLAPAETASAQDSRAAAPKRTPPRLSAYLSKREVTCGDTVKLTGIIGVVDSKQSSLQTVRVRVHRLAAFHRKTGEKLYLDNTHHRFVFEIQEVFPDLRDLGGSSHGMAVSLAVPGELRYSDEFVAQRAGVYLLELSCALYIQVDKQRTELKLSAEPIMLTVQPKRTPKGKITFDRDSMSGITEQQQADFEEDGNATPDD